MPITSAQKIKQDRQQYQTCPGLDEFGEKCRYQVLDNKRCCSRAHADMEHYTDEMFNQVKKCIHCSRTRWRVLIDDKYCDKCDIKYCHGKEKGTDVRCRLKAVNGNRYCSRNHGYMNGYTDDMLNDLKECTTCKRRLHSNNYENNLSTCIDCQKRAGNNRVKERIIKAETKSKCKHYECTNYAMDNKNFCGIHEMDQVLLDAKEKNMKVCANYNRKCRQQLLPLDYPHSKCESCLKKLGVIEKEIRDKLIKTRKCTECKKDLSDDDKGLLCKEHKQYAYEYNRERVRRVTTTNIHKVKIYIKKAAIKNRIYSLTDAEALELFRNSCHYCGMYYSDKNDYGEEFSMMGIDRIDNSIGYISDNVVTACRLCNRLKYTFGYDTFFRYIMNIYNNFGSLQPHSVEKNITVVSYTKHANYAKDKGRSTELSRCQYYGITETHMCYYCNCTNTTYLNIDRVDSTKGYNIKNRLVSCCSVCNIMKSDMDINEFKAKIIEILVHHNKIPKTCLDGIKRNNMLPTTSIKKLNENITKLYEYNGKQNWDRRNKHALHHESQYYIDKIWNSFDIRRLEPEIEFCETQEQISHWMYYRLAISSHFPEKRANFDTLILIRDKFTKNYIGIASLTISRPAMTTNRLKEVVRKKNIYNISTCVAIPPFSFNFCGGKLLLMLMFSDVVFEYMKAKNHMYAGLLTYSLHGDSIQYASVEGVSLIGYSTNVSGRDNTKVPSKVYDAMIKVMKHKKYPICSSKPANIKTYCRRQGIPDASRHGILKSVYFGTCGGNSYEYLKGNTGELKPDLLTVSEISEKWYTLHVLPRIQELIKRNKFMPFYDYDTYYMDSSSYDRHRKKRSLLIKNQDLRKKEQDKQLILYCWFDNQDHKISNLIKIINIEAERREMTVNIDARTLCKYIQGYDMSKLDQNTLTELMNHINSRKILEVKSKTPVLSITMNQIDRYCRHRHKFIRSYNERKIKIKKSKMFLSSQQFDDIKHFKFVSKIDNIKRGEWKIKTIDNSTNVESNIIHLVSMRVAENIKCDQIEKRNIKFKNLVLKLGMSQSSTDFLINDLGSVNANINITGKSNIFIDIDRITDTNNIKLRLGMSNKMIISIDVYIVPLKLDINDSLSNTRIMANVLNNRRIYRMCYLNNS